MVGEKEDADTKCWLGRDQQALTRLPPGHYLRRACLKQLARCVPHDPPICVPFTLLQTALAYARVWHHVDASDRVLGKLAERIAIVLMGKHKPIFDASGTSDEEYVLNRMTETWFLYASGLRRLRSSFERSEGEGHRKEGPTDCVPTSHYVPWRSQGDSVQANDGEET